MVAIPVFVTDVSISPEEFIVDTPNKAPSRNRANDELRKIYIKTNVAASSKGSAYIECGGTKVLASVSGPRDVPKSEMLTTQHGLLKVHVKYANFACRSRLKRNVRVKDTTLDVESQLSQLLCNAFKPVVCLDKYPKSLIDVSVTVLEDDGSVSAIAMSCISVALAYAGIEMFDLLVGFSAKIENDHILIDPSNVDESRTGDGLVSFGMMPSLNQVTAFHLRGSVSPETVQKVIQSSTLPVSTIRLLVEHCLKMSLREKLKF